MAFSEVVKGENEHMVAVGLGEPLDEQWHYQYVLAQRFSHYDEEPIQPVEEEEQAVQERS